MSRQENSKGPRTQKRTAYNQDAEECIEGKQQMYACSESCFSNLRDVSGGCFSYPETTTR